MRERRAHELPRAGGAVRRDERVGTRSPARAAGNPQVQLPADDPGDPFRAQARADDVSQQAPDLEDLRAAHGAHVGPPPAPLSARTSERDNSTRQGPVQTRLTGLDA